MCSRIVHFKYIKKMQRYKRKFSKECTRSAPAIMCIPPLDFAGTTFLHGDRALYVQNRVQIVICVLRWLALWVLWLQVDLPVGLLNTGITQYTSETQRLY